MKRNVSLEEISDGKLYTSNDMVKADCGDCEGCSACCHGMGESIVLDPLDIYRLTTNLEMTFEQLLSQYVELNVVDGIILPNLKMAGSNEACGFLDRNGRCSIHAHRPGICRLFPLGRYYEDGGFQYFLQTHECKKENRTKVKVKKWIDTPNVALYKAQNIRQEVEGVFQHIIQKEIPIKDVQLVILNPKYYYHIYQMAKRWTRSFFKQ